MATSMLVTVRHWRILEAVYVGDNFKRLVTKSKESVAFINSPTLWWHQYHCIHECQLEVTWGHLGSRRVNITNATQLYCSLGQSKSNIFLNNHSKCNFSHFLLFFSIFEVIWNVYLYIALEFCFRKDQKGASWDREVVFLLAE